LGSEHRLTWEGSIPFLNLIFRKETEKKLSSRQYGLDLPMSMLTPAVRATTTALFLNLVERVEQNVST